VLDLPLPLAITTWTKFWERADGAMIAVGTMPGGIKVQVRATPEGIWSLRVARFPPSAWAPVEELVSLTEMALGNVRDMPPALRLKAMWRDALQALAARGIDLPDIPIETSVEGDRRRVVEQAEATAAAVRRQTQVRADRAQEAQARRRAKKLDGRTYEAAARTMFGITEDPYLAGYILADGDLLDLSGGQRERVIDHREVARAHPDALGGQDGMEEFMAKTGAIRIGVPRSLPRMVWVHAATPATHEQVRTLEYVLQFVEPDYVELLKAGRPRVELQAPSVQRVLREAQRLWSAR